MKTAIKLLVLIMFIGACKEEKHKPLAGGGGQPGVVKNVKVENSPGGAKITYALPEDSDLLYVTAFFSTKDNEVRSAKSSLYNNFVEIEGFADTSEYEVTLYAVNRAEIKSAPVSVKIKPMAPPIQAVFASLEAREDFGGINVKFKNDMGTDFIIYTMIKDGDGKWVRLDKLFTNAKSRSYAIRGLTAVEREFAIFITDKYKNNSDTLFKTLTPLYEEKLNKKIWKRGNLPSDYYTARYPTGETRPREIEKIWDDLHGTYDYYQQHQISPQLPSRFTIDLGVKMKLSRMKIQQYEGTGTYAFIHGNPRLFEIWGSNEKVDDMSAWTKLLDCESVKPSGLPYGSRTAEDLAYALAGEDYMMPIDAEPVRYIRFVLKATWANVNYLTLDEISFWGQDPTKKP